MDREAFVIDLFKMGGYEIVPINILPDSVVVIKKTSKIMSNTYYAYFKYVLSEENIDKIYDKAGGEAIFARLQTLSNEECEYEIDTMLKKELGNFIIHTSVDYKFITNEEELFYKHRNSTEISVLRINPDDDVILSEEKIKGQSISKNGERELVFVKSSEQYPAYVLLFDAKGNLIAKKAGDLICPNVFGDIFIVKDKYNMFRSSQGYEVHTYTLISITAGILNDNPDFSYSIYERVDTKDKEYYVCAGPRKDLNRDWKEMIQPSYIEKYTNGNCEKVSLEEVQEINTTKNKLRLLDGPAIYDNFIFMIK